MEAAEILRPSPVKRLRQAVIAARHPIALLSFIRAMRAAKEVGTAPHATSRNIKYVGSYLSERFSPQQRRNVILFHHHLLAARFRPDVWQRKVVLWRKRIGDQSLCLILRAADLAPMEGEHELAFVANDMALSTLTFAFADQGPTGEPADQRMFIGGVQGPYNAREAVRIAAKANDEIAPVTMVMIAAKALAHTLGIGRMMGVSAAHHPARRYAAGRILFDYDQLWRDAGAEASAEGWFILAPELRDRPLLETSRDHRRRTRMKRERKEQIFAEICAATSACLRTEPRRT